MALLCLMRPLAEENGITLTVCHVNHGLRGETADRDEAFVREACARLGLPLQVFHAAELEAEVGRPQAGEDWARRLRYACFGRLLAEGIDAVATAHTGSDRPRRCCSGWPGERASTVRRASGPADRATCGPCSA